MRHLTNRLALSLWTEPLADTAGVLDAPALVLAVTDSTSTIVGYRPDGSTWRPTSADLIHLASELSTLAADIKDDEHER